MRFTPEAARAWRQAIEEAGGNEVFALGRLDAEGRVASVEVLCRGHVSAVPAILGRPRAGEAVIHNHPSGVLEASEADMQLAGWYGENGVGVVITDNAATRDYWVVEPHRPRAEAVDEAAVRRFFAVDLPRALPGAEARAPQVDMALAVARALSAEAPTVAVLEAGTGTGKTLAWLVPAALWARANQGRVVAATYTRNLQGQVIHDDVPLARRAGLDFRWAVLEGRNNYLCLRRLERERAQAARRGDEEARAELDRLAAWAETTATGKRDDLGDLPVDDEVWESVQSDSDYTLRARCPHFERCFYYRARREAAAADVIVVNQHLLLADRLLRDTPGARPILPDHDRVILDEAHHVEDAATSVFHRRLSRWAVRRLGRRLLDRERRRKRRDGTVEVRVRAGALSVLRGHADTARAGLDGPTRARVHQAIDDVERGLREVVGEADNWFEAIALEALSERGEPRRIDANFAASPAWRDAVEAALADMATRLVELARRMDELEELLGDMDGSIERSDPQPFQDLRVAARRVGALAALAADLRRHPDDPGEEVAWIEREGGRGGRGFARLAIAPVEVGDTLRRVLFDPVHAAVLTSATLMVAGRPDHLLGRLGLGDLVDAPGGGGEGRPRLDSRVFPSPFDYAAQAVLGLPRDLPDPREPGWLEAVARATCEAVEAAGGGAFVLCTSYSLVDALHRAAEARLGGRFALFRQGRVDRRLLLERFRQARDGVLFGTDSFWEGVSVPGRALRLVVIPKLPFRVPTDPIEQARAERVEARGESAFYAYALPSAVLRLRQGIGRLVRTRADRGAVLLLDRRLLSARYGRVFLASLPPMRRLTGPWRAVREELERLFG